jgi:protein phosphatase
MTHKGQVRSANEDTLVLPGLMSIETFSESFETTYSDECATFAVIDGMGGHRGGQDASRLVARHFLTNPTVDVGQLLDSANDLLYETALRDRDLAGMGATIAGVRCEGSMATIFNIGDARVYQWSQGYLLLVTEDDRASPGSNVVTQCLGGSERRTRIAPHVTAMELNSGDRLVVCCDGLSDIVTFQQIQELLAGESIKDVVGALLNAALSSGAPDNVSIIVLERSG